MNCKVYYVSPKGCAESIADAIARVCDCPKEPLLPAYMPEGVQLMFLGCEGGRADKVTLEFISVMSTQRIRRAALFCCGIRATDAIGQMRGALEKRGVEVLEPGFTAPMKGLFGSGPKGPDLEAAAAFAKQCMDMAIAE